MPQADAKIHLDSFPGNDASTSKRIQRAPCVRVQRIDGAPWFYADDVAAAIGLWSLAELDRRTAQMGLSTCRAIALLPRGKGACIVTLLSRAGAEALSRTRRGKLAEDFRCWLRTQA